MGDRTNDNIADIGVGPTIDGFIDGLLGAYKESRAQLADRFTNLRYGDPGHLLFEFDGDTYRTDEPSDVMPVMAGWRSQQYWCMDRFLDRKCSAA